ncbi:MAG: Rpn family recombination-promoting nuclease/putative transposase, partial [Candidatus Competibacteraceae bacterium]
MSLSSPPKTVPAHERRARLLTLYDPVAVRAPRGERGRRLPPVVPVVLYNGRRRWTAATELAELIALGPAGLEVYRPQLRYVLIDENAYADAELSTLRNLAAALFRLEGSRGPETVREVVSALAAWLADEEQAELRRSFVLWLREAFFRARFAGGGVARTERSGGGAHHAQRTGGGLDATVEAGRPPGRPPGRGSRLAASAVNSALRGAAGVGGGPVGAG